MTCWSPRAVSDCLKSLFANNQTSAMTKPEIVHLREELRSLPASTRALLAHDLLESLDETDKDSEFEAAWAQVAERRLDEVLNGVVKTIPGETVLKRVRNRKR